MGCHNCTPSKGDEAKTLKNGRASLRVAPQQPLTEFGINKLSPTTVGGDSLDKLFRKVLRTYQTKTIPFTHTTIPDSHSTHDTSLPSINTSFKLQQELKLATEVLPLNTESSIFLFVNESDPSILKAFIAGPAFTPYAHGLFEFDIFLQDQMDLPQKVQFNTTGGGSVSFSDYLPITGVVDLCSLNLMTPNSPETPGRAKSSHISSLVLSLQNLLRTGAIFGAYGDHSTPIASSESGEGMREYKAYCNIIKYATIQYAMLDHLENGPPELADFIQTYFFLKKDIILDECKKWLADAQLDNGNYDTSIARRNPDIAQDLRNGAYFVRLNMLIMRLQEILERININQSSSMIDSWRRKTGRDTVSKQSS